MNLDNFVVRPKRRFVERYAQEEAWKTLVEEQVGELAEHVASLPTELMDDDEDAKRFDLLMLNLQLALLNAGPGVRPAAGSGPVNRRPAVGEGQHPDGAGTDGAD